MLESALALPFFLCALTALLYLLVFTGEQAVSFRRLSEKVQALAVTTGKTSGEEPYITLYDHKKAKLPFSLGQSLRIRSVKARVWVGYTGESFSQSLGGPFVYMTPEREVYHRSQECAYLQLSIRSISSGELPAARNASGGKYAACEYCAGRSSAYRIVYITDYGDCYHNVRSCQGLKRTVMAVPFSRVLGVPCCIKCAGK